MCAGLTLLVKSSEKAPKKWKPTSLKHKFHPMAVTVAEGPAMLNSLVSKPSCQIPAEMILGYASTLENNDTLYRYFLRFKYE